MSLLSFPALKLAMFALVLAAAFGGGALLGATVGPSPSRSPMPTMDHDAEPDHTVAP